MADTETNTMTFQIATDANFDNIIYSYTGLQIMELTDNFNLAQGITYYARVQYYVDSVKKYSAWSPHQNFHYCTIS